MDSRISARGLAGALGGWRTRAPAYEALADGIRLLCLDNRLAPRTALPAERELAAVLGLSRTTVSAAYQSLRDSGHIDSLRGSGSVTLPVGRRTPRTVDADADAIDLQQASPAAWPGLAGVMSEIAQDAASLVARAGYDMIGSLPLRTAIADRYCATGIPTSPDQVMVTTGAQSAIHLLASTFVRRGDRALVETPTYPHAADAFRSAGARLVAVPVTTDAGWDLDRAVQALTRTSPTLAYLMPQFQNPTGRTMSQLEQHTLAEAAERSRTRLVLDETTADLAIDGPAVGAAGGEMPATAGMARTAAIAGANGTAGADGSVTEPPAADAPIAGAPFRDVDAVRIGSLGKTVWGGIRIGWIRADVELIRRLVAERPRRDLGTPDFEQAVAARLLARFPEIVSQRSLLLKEGRDALVTALRERLPAWKVPSVGGGVSLWVELDAPLSSGLVLAARDEGLYLSAGPRFAAVSGHDRHLRLPFTAPGDELRRAVDILARVWPDVRLAAPTAVPDLVSAVV